jgi:hypothetical protein
MPTLLRILPQVLHISYNQTLFYFQPYCASLQCFTFLISAKFAIIFSTLHIILIFSKKNFSLSQLFHLLGTDTDPDRPNPDRHALYAAPDQDPA